MSSSARAPTEVEVEVVVIGGGQAGLATGFHLRRAGLVPGRDFLVLDAAPAPGGAWPRTWDGLRLFSPAGYSSLPGWMMPAWQGDGFPPRDHVVDYLTRYEQRYELAVARPHRVRAVTRLDDDPAGRLLVDAGDLSVSARVVVSATGTWEQPFWPAYPGGNRFGGRQLHTVAYRRPEDFAGEHVVVVGGGNSAAQVLAEVSTVASTTWVAPRPPRFLPDDVDGRDLFAAATARVRALQEGREHAGVGGLGDIVMVASVLDARDRGALVAEPMFSRLTTHGIQWEDEREERCDAVIWCTGFRPVVRHLRDLRLPHRHGRPETTGPAGTQAVGEPRLFLVGYGDWTGPASATLIGVGRSARATVEEITQRLGR